MSRISSFLILVVVALSLSACGGGGGGSGSAVADNVPPASAGTSIAGFVTYLQSLTSASSETADPVDVSDFVAPASETDEPTSI